MRDGREGELTWTEIKTRTVSIAFRNHEIKLFKRVDKKSYTKTFGISALHIRFERAINTAAVPGRPFEGKRFDDPFPVVEVGGEYTG